MNTSESWGNQYTRKQRDEYGKKVVEALIELVRLSGELSLPRLTVCTWEGYRASLFSSTMSVSLCIVQGALVIEQRWGRRNDIQRYYFAEDYRIPLDVLLEEHLVGLPDVDKLTQAAWAWPEITRLGNDICDIGLTKHVPIKRFTEHNGGRGVYLYSAGIFFAHGGGPFSEADFSLQFSDPRLLDLVSSWNIRSSEIIAARLKLDLPR